jgi:hypothetical protein
MISAHCNLIATQKALTIYKAKLKIMQAIYLWVSEPRL